MPRQDAEGLVIAYAEKNSNTLDDMTLESVFSDFLVNMHGVIMVCLDDTVVSTNQETLLGKTMQEMRKYYNSRPEGNESRIIRIKLDHKIWYGHKDKMKEYAIYIFFPASQIFMARTVVCGLYTAVAILVYLLFLLIKSNLEKVTLKQSQKRMRIINALGTAYASIVLFDLEKDKVEMIKTSGDTSMLSGDQILSKKIQQNHINEMLTSEYREGFQEFIDMDTVAQRLKGQQSLTYTSQMEKGTWLLSVIVPQRFDSDGNIRAVLLANRDITKEKEKELEQERELRNALAAAEHANKAKTNFLNSISHDIRTPMNAVIGFTTLAVSNIDNKEKVRDYLGKILSSSNHLLSLINDVLDMSRIESGKIHLEETEVSLSDMLHDLKTIISGHIYAKQLELYMDAMDITDEDVYCDKTRLNQVLLNLLSNAIKFTPAGGTVSVRLKQFPGAKKGSGLYEIRVKDSGIGMSQEFVQKIFSPFERERTSTVSRTQGTGLGMAITKNIVDMMGGTIEVRTEQGKGTEFIVRLPLRIQSEQRSIEKIAELEDLKALVVDDDFNTCDSVTKMLVKVGMRSEWTLSGKEAVLRARQSMELGDAFHAYIIDWRLPDMNGIEVTRQIRSLGDDTPIIILTAYDWSDIEAEARAAGVTAFCAKPLFMSDIRETLMTAIGQSQSEPEDSVLPAAGSDFRGRCILLVEDNELNREIAVELLNEYGFLIDSAENGAEAVEKVKNSEPGNYDLVLMDVQMPVMNGYEATKQIRALDDPALAGITILAMTANAFDEDRKKALKCGMDGFLSKPIVIEELISTLQKNLDQVSGV